MHVSRQQAVGADDNVLAAAALAHDHERCGIGHSDLAVDKERPPKERYRSFELYARRP
jgi:hypothetical protein